MTVFSHARRGVSPWDSDPPWGAMGESVAFVGNSRQEMGAVCREERRPKNGFGDMEDPLGRVLLMTHENHSLPFNPKDSHWTWDISPPFPM